MIECPGIQKKTIRAHYDLSTLFYRLMWGPHIHHGLWQANESSRQAQVQLVEHLAKLAEIQKGARIVDVGCGMGGSSRWLASKLKCRVTGVTLSPVQRRWAQVASLFASPGSGLHFVCQDAEQIEFPQTSVDVVWSIECTEHLFEKANFFQRAAGWLKPGGKMAICAWLAGQNETCADTVQHVQRVCEGMFCPSLGTQADYEQWFSQAGLQVVESQLWTDRVMKTWEICKSRVEKSGVRALARMLGKEHVLFLDRFTAILEAYQNRTMEYGCFVGVKAGGNCG
ncbi:MAG: class I SAM-dependent methyltransferase [Planctomycetales bacterium]|nr:class I SAM-dependent methyltransferase [Planctomycetales bacterium]